MLSLALRAGWQHPFTMPPTLLFRRFSPASKLSLPVTSSSPTGSCSCHSRVCVCPHTHVGPIPNGGMREVIRAWEKTLLNEMSDLLYSVPESFLLPSAA